MSVTPSTLIASAATPTDPAQLWSVPFIFMANWDGGVTVRQSFMTDVIQAQSGLEQRRALTLCPTRIFEVDVLINDAKQIGYFRAWMMRAAQSRFTWPVHTDRLRCTGGSVNTINVNIPSGDLAKYRLQSGQRVAVVKFDQNRLPTYYNVDTTNTVAGGSGFTLTSGTDYSFLNSTYYVYPLVEAELLLEQSAASISAGVLTANLVISESRGNFTLDTLAAIGSNPGGLTFNGYPLLNIEPDCDSNKIGMTRLGAYTQSGRGKVLQLFDSRPRFNYELSWLQLTRTKSANLIKWFEAMAGRLLPFYLLSPLIDWKPISFTGTTVTVESSLLANDWPNFPAIGVLMSDGTYQLRLITGTAQSGNNWILTVAAWSVTPTLATCKRIACAQLVRFDTDEMVEKWQTDGVMASSLTLLELTAENSLTITDIKDFTQGYI